jgi:hypothetical protein
MSRAPLLRPEFGPTLPELISGRFSVSRRAVAIGAVIALIVLVFVVKTIVDSGNEKLVVHGKPSFNVEYDPSHLHKAAPRGSDLMRLTGHTAHVDTEITARHANLPPFKGDVIGGQLPLYTAQYAGRLGAALPGFALGTEGKARVNKSPGYQITYTSGQAGDKTSWREVWVMPEVDKPDQTIVVKLRQTVSGRPGPRGRALLQATKKAFRSFRFGTRRALFG